MSKVLKLNVKPPRKVDLVRAVNYQYLGFKYDNDRLEFMRKLPAIAKAVGSSVASNSLGLNNATVNKIDTSELTVAYYHSAKSVGGVSLGTQSTYSSNGVETESIDVDPSFPKNSFIAIERAVHNPFDYDNEAFTGGLNKKFCVNYVAGLFIGSVMKKTGIQIYAVEDIEDLAQTTSMDRKLLGNSSHVDTAVTEYAAVDPYRIAARVAYDAIAYELSERSTGSEALECSESGIRQGVLASTSRSAEDSTPFVNSLGQPYPQIFTLKY